VADLEHLRLRALAKLRGERTSREKLYRRHPWSFVRDCCRTLDEITGKVRRFPRDDGEGRRETCACGGCSHYVECLVNTWHRERFLLVPKSRRMVVTWTLVACHYWLARFRENSKVAFASRKQGLNDSEGSAELVKRAKFIDAHLPPEVPPVLGGRGAYAWCRAQFPNGSEIVGIGQGADQARQYTFTAYFADEMAFWEQAKESYVAIMPTLEGGGRFTGVSSANPGFFRQMCYDELDAAGPVAR